MKGFSLSTYHTAGAPNAVTTPLNLGILDAVRGDVYNEVTIVNDTDQDVKIKYSLSNGVQNEIIVPKSIKGLTRRIACGDLAFILASFTVNSLSAGSAAVGNITLNFIG